MYELIIIFLLMQASPHHKNTVPSSQQIQIIHALDSYHYWQQLKAINEINNTPDILQSSYMMTHIILIVNHYNRIYASSDRIRKKYINGKFNDIYEKIVYDILLMHGNLGKSSIYKTLLYSIYNPESKMAFILAGQGGKGFKDVMQMYHQTQVPWGKTNAIGVISYILQRYYKNDLIYPLQPGQIQMLKAIMFRALMGNDYGNLLTAIHYYQAVGNKNIMPALFKLKRRHYCGCKILEDYLLCNELEKASQRIDQRAIKP